jgi:hypothetical protein
VSLLGKVQSAEALARLLVPRRPSRLFSIGDSHSAALRYTQNVTVVHAGPVTLHRAGRSGELPELIAASLLGPTLGQYAHRFARPIVELVIRERDAALLFFGEIDVRAHFERHWPDYGSPRELARSLATRGAVAGAAIGEMTGAQIGFASVTPPGEVDDEQLPMRGTFAERVEWTVLLNQELAIACEEVGVSFVDFFAEYADECGRIRREISDGTIHIRPECTFELRQACEQSGLLPQGLRPQRAAAIISR